MMNSHSRQKRITAAVLSLATALIAAHAAGALYQAWVLSPLFYRLLSATAGTYLVWLTSLLIQHDPRARRIAAWILLASAGVFSLAPPENDWRIALIVLLNLTAGTYLGFATLAQLFTEWVVQSSLRFRVLVLAAVPTALGLSYVVGVFGMQRWFAYLVLGAAVLCGARTLYRNVFQRLEGLFGPRPDELKGEPWRRFRNAYLCRAIGNLPKAAALLPQSQNAPPSVSILRGLIRVDEAQRLDSLERIIYDAGYVPGVEQRDQFAQESIILEDAATLVAERNQLIELLVYASPSARAFYGVEIERSLSLLTMQRFDNDRDQSFQTWWERTKAGTAAGGELAWLTARLWEAGCTESALALAERAKDPDWIEVLTIARLVEAASLDGEALAPVVYEYAEAACLVPMMSEWAGLYLLDSTITVERGAAFVARKLKSRGRVIAFLRKIWEDYEDCCSIRPATLLAVMTGYRSGLFVSRRGFDRWWAEKQESGEAYEFQIAAGLEWAAIQDWHPAERAFEKAHRLAPESASARYNRAYCHIQMDNLPTAERLLGDLVQDEPDEALWWVRLGDTRRLMQENIGALTAYRRAVELIGDTPDLVFRLVAVLVEEGRESEARELLRATTLNETEKGMLLGQSPSVSTNSGWDLESWGSDSDDETPPSVH